VERPTITVVQTMKASKPTSKKAPAVSHRIIEGLEEAIAWSKGDDVAARVTVIAKHPESAEDV
jgi:hypothetical protein